MDTSTATYNSKAVRLSQRLVQDIDGGLWTPGAVLPSQLELAEKYKVSRDTIQRALSLLDEKGKVQRLGHGKVQVPLVSPGCDGGASVGTACGTIAAVWSAEPDYHLMQCRKGIADYAAEHGLELKIFLASGGHEPTLQTLDTIRDHGIDGVLVFPYSHPDYVRAVRRLTEQGVPLVCMDRRVQGMEVGCVQFDNASGMYEATHYLIEKYSRPVYYVSNLRDHSTLIADYEGYQHAMADAALASFVGEYSCLGRTSDGDPRFWALGKKWLGAKDAIDQFFGKAVFPASVLCLNDYVAQGIYEMAAARQLTIGKDVCVVGFGDYPLGRFLRPTLTTVHSPVYQMGYDAARLLHQTMCKRVTTPAQIHLPVELVVRESA